MYATDLTVGAVVEHDENFLIVEESAMGRRVLSQPGGHIEAGESPEQAVVRETLEETGCHVRCGDLIGVYLWIHPQTRQQYLRLMYAAAYVGCDSARPLDEGIFARRWMSHAELMARKPRLRTPVVLRALDDFLAGRREPRRLLSNLLPLQSNMQRILASADLV